MSNPDLVDLVQDWLMEEYPQLCYEVVQGKHCSGGKIIIVKIEPGYTLKDFHAFTLSVNHRIWHYGWGAFNATLNPADPNFFPTLKWAIDRAKTRRETYAT